ncbi:MAG: AAA family ATPase [Candidatus Nealsonbacteria bacterium]
MPNKIICIVGMPGSGKSVVADELVREGFAFLRFGQITLDIVKERGLAPVEKNEREVREGLRKEHGMAAFAILNIPKIDELLEKSDVAVDGLYSWSEYKVLKEKYGDLMSVIAVFAPPKLRYGRLTGRSVKDDMAQRFRNFTKEEARSRDYAEIENLEKGGPIVMADFTIVNTGSLDQLKENIGEVLSQIK